MTILRPILIAAALTGLSGCASMQSPKPMATSPSAVELPPTKADRWKAVAGADDIDRIRRLPAAWDEGLREARVRNAAAIREEGLLLRPDAALPRPAPTPGSYNCRLVRLGKTDAKSLSFVRFKPFFCYVEVEKDLLTIVKQTGSERPAGRLWDDDDPTRLIYLGSLALGNEDQPKAYGEDPKRDMAGVLERIAPMRWRLVIPWGRSGSKVDVFELTPVAQQPKS